MKAPSYRFAGIALPLLLAGCMVEQRDFEALREQVRIQQKQINDLKARQEEQTLRVDTLNNGFKILSDKADENSRRIDDLGDQGASRPASAPLVASAPASAPPPPPVPAPAAAAPAAATSSAPVPISIPDPILLTNLPKGAAPEPPPAGELITAAPKAEKLYAGALALFSNRDYAQATGSFEEFVATYPDHKLAGNAQYWIGECYYSQKRFSEAAEEFAKVEKSFPASPKVPAALLKKGLSLWELKKLSDAQAALQRILDKYPQAEEAAKARERLERWKQP